MKRPVRSPSNCTISRAEFLEARLQFSVSLWVDANSTPASYPSALATAPVIVGSKAFFTVDDGAHGKELWCTDGTEGGTRLVLDINPGTASSVPSDGPRMCALNGKLFFVANDGVHGEEIWVSNGTAAGTHLVSDLTPGLGEASAFNLTAFGNYVYFFGSNDSSNGFSLFRADENGAALFQSIRNSTLVHSNTPFTVIGNTMYYNGLNSMPGLWATDGTTGGTRLLLSKGVGSMSPLNGKLFCYYTTTASGAEPWISDGTVAGTVQIADLNPGSASSTPSNPISFNGKTYFFATDATHGTALWSSGGTAATTSLVIDLKGALNLTSPSDLVATSSRLAFRALASDGRRHLYVSDGTVGGTVVLTTPAGADLGPLANQIVSTANAIYFLGDTFNVSRGIYSIGNTGFTTTYSVTGLSSDAFVMPFQGGVLTLGNDAVTGKELWLANPATNSAIRLADAFPGSNSSSPTALVRAGNRIYFYANPVTGNLADLWASDLDGTHPHLVANSVPYSSLEAKLAPIGTGDSVAFLATTPQGRQLWVSDGSAAGTHALNVAIGEDETMFYNPGPRILSLGGRVYFSGSDAEHGRELWSSDGTEAGTGLVADLSPGAASSMLYLMNVAGEKLFFTAYVGGTSRFYSSDGTATSTTWLPLPNKYIDTLAPQSAVLNGLLYFIAVDQSTAARQMYLTDGTVVGTEPVRLANQINTYSAAFDPIATNNRVFFRAESTTQGSELWQIGPAGASLVKDINPGSGGSVPDLMGAVGNRLLFTATSATNVTQVWTSDGTSTGTTVLYPFTQPTSGFILRYLGTNQGKAFFMGNEAATGTELWKTDGTTAGTTIVNDLVTGAGSSSTYAPSFAAYDDRVIVGLNDGYRGEEPWITDDERAPTIVSSAYDHTTSPKATIAFDESMDATIDLSKISIVATSTGAVFHPTTAAFDPTGRIATVSLPKTLPNGNFTVQIAADAFKDLAAHPAAVGASVNFYNLPGDANDDRTVTFADLVILAQNYGQDSRTFSQGNFDYSDDGKVDFSDLVLLAQNYGVSIAPALIAPAKIVVGPAGTTTRRGNVAGILS